MLSFQTAAGRGENHGRTDDTQCMAPVCVCVPSAVFFPSDKTSRAPPKKIGSNLHGLLHAARQMEKLELAGLGQMRHSLKINWTGIGIKGGNQKLRRDQWDVC